MRSLIQADLRVEEFAPGGHDCVIVLKHSGVEPPRSDFNTGTGHCFRGQRAVDITATDQRQQILMARHLFTIFMDAIVGDENPGGRTVALCVDRLIEDAGGREPCGACLDAVFFGQSRCQTGTLNLGAVLSGPLHCVVERDGYRAGRCLREDRTGKKQRNSHKNAIRQTKNPFRPVDHNCLKNS